MSEGYVKVTIEVVRPGMSVEVHTSQVAMNPGLRSAAGRALASCIVASIGFVWETIAEVIDGLRDDRRVVVSDELP